MTYPTFASILALEERLEAAMRESDTRALGDLLADDLLFTNHEGRLLSKSDDLFDHASGKLRFSMVSSSNRVIQLFRNTAVVAVAVQVRGSYADIGFTGAFRFTRVWTVRGGQWQVTAAQATRAVF